MRRSLLKTAIRVWTEPIKSPAGPRRPIAERLPPWPHEVLIFDTETTIDPTQRLLFGAYRYGVWSGTQIKVLEEGLIHADELEQRDPVGLGHLREYAGSHRADVQDPQWAGPLRLRSRREFVFDVFYKAAYKNRGLVVGFNLPFDLARLAVSWKPARGRQYGGFSFVLADYEDRERGDYLESHYHPRVIVRTQDSKRASIRFGALKAPDDIDLIPEGSIDGQPDRAYRYRGRFLDLRTLAFVLTGKGYSLASAAQEFGTLHRKSEPHRHGVIEPAYIEYNRNDVLVTQELLEKLRAEFDTHPVALLPDRAKSPASLAKAYRRAMGLAPLAARSRLSADQLGAATSAYFGGRAECRIRRVLLPVVYTDFLSMYPTVNVLMNLWRFSIAQTIGAVDATEEVRQLLGAATLDGYFAPEGWRDLGFFAQIVPDGDVLPVRANYGGGTFTIGVNPFTARALRWYAGPDLVAAVLLTGKPPRVLQACRLLSAGTMPDLQAVRLGGAITVDPNADDFFRIVIEARKRLPMRGDLTPARQDQLDQLLKVIANSGSYGIFAELNRQHGPPDRRTEVVVYDGAIAYRTHVAGVDTPGAFCYMR